MKATSDGRIGPPGNSPRLSADSQPRFARHSVSLVIKGGERAVESWVVQCEERVTSLIVEPSREIAIDTEGQIAKTTESERGRGVPGNTN